MNKKISRLLLLRKSVVFMTGLLGFIAGHTVASDAKRSNNQGPPLKMGQAAFERETSGALDLMTLGFVDAISRAKHLDPWKLANQLEQQSLLDEALAQNGWDDPMFSIGVNNLAANTFSFNQEAMSQIKLGVMQSIPRGDSRQFKQRQFTQLANQYPFQRMDRDAKVEVVVGHLWLDAYQAHQSAALVKSSRILFEQLADIAQANYASTVGNTRQQDIVRAQLELTQLDERLSKLQQQYSKQFEALDTWTNPNTQHFDENIRSQSGLSADFLAGSENSSRFRQVLSKEMPEIKMTQPEVYLSSDYNQPASLMQSLLLHPSIKAWEQNIAASKSGIEIAKQNYKTKFSLNASYGYRDNAPNSITMLDRERADLFSIGVSFELPLFAENRVDSQVSSAVKYSQAKKFKRWLLLRNLYQGVQTNRAVLKGLISRDQLYETQLLPQLNQLSEASLTAYTNDDGGFSEVIKARIEELNGAIELLTIKVEIKKTVLSLNYYFSNTEESNTTNGQFQLGGKNND
ncbi:MAG: TolC family protein [Kangiellaceae bacterium]|nr:TolC family protein [Kangiellaceae bacterium]